MVSDFLSLGISDSTSYEKKKMSTDLVVCIPEKS